VERRQGTPSRAALAYYSVFSLAPLLVISLALKSFVFRQSAAERQISDQLRGLLGDEGAQAVQSLLVSARKPTSGTLATILGVAALLFGASGVFGELQDSLNTIWKVQSKPGPGIWGIIRVRFLSFAMVLGIGFLLLVSLVISNLLSGLTAVLGDWLPSSQFLAQSINVAVSLATIKLLFAMMFKVLPDVTIAWRDVWLGAFVTALLFTVGKQLVGLYLGQTSIGSAYGAAGSVIIVLLWAYYSAQILILGAALTRVYACMYGSRIEVSLAAMPMKVCP
jgi:membrane protein